MRRIVITNNKKGETVVQGQRLSKRPSGNGQQRAKQIRNGWKPEWIDDGQPVLLSEFKALPDGVCLTTKCV